MKKLKSWLFSLLLIVGLMGLLGGSADAFAQAPGSAPPATAQAVGATPSAAGAEVAAPWWSGPEALSAVFALVTGLFAVWTHKEKRTAQRVSESLILGIEAASKIPAVAEKERAFKAKIKEVTRDYGVGPVVAALVSRLT
jgi:hypothetical protein